MSGGHPDPGQPTLQQPQQRAVWFYGRWAARGADLGLGPCKADPQVGLEWAQWKVGCWGPHSGWHLIGVHPPLYRKLQSDEVTPLTTVAQIPRKSNLEDTRMWLRLSGTCALIILIWLYRLHEKLSTGTMSIMETLFQSLVSQGHLKTAYQVFGGDRGWHILFHYHLLNQMSAGLSFCWQSNISHFKDGSSQEIKN